MLSLEKIQNFIFCLRVTKTTYRTDQNTQNDKRKSLLSHKNATSNARTLVMLEYFTKSKFNVCSCFKW